MLQKLSPQMVEEALIIAEMFELNEISALQLLVKGKMKANLILSCKLKSCFFLKARNNYVIIPA